MNSPNHQNDRRVLVIMGSVRAGRHCPQITEWVVGIARQTDGLSFETIDLRDWHLPLDDEPVIPAQGSYNQPHTKAWSEKVAGADAVVIVTPQYNWGYPAVLKNALDHLYAEWRDKPLLIVTYGGHGGVKCAAQLRQVAEALKMKPCATMPALTISHEAIIGGRLDAGKDLLAFEASVIEAVGELKEALS